jgi:hypothetical protein
LGTIFKVKKTKYVKRYNRDYASLNKTLPSSDLAAKLQSEAFFVKALELLNTKSESLGRYN